MIRYNQIIIESKHCKRFEDNFSEKVKAKFFINGTKYVLYTTKIIKNSRKELRKELLIKSILPILTSNCKTDKEEELYNYESQFKSLIIKRLKDKECII